MGKNLSSCIFCGALMSQLAEECPRCYRSRKICGPCQICSAPVYKAQDVLGFEGPKRDPKFRYYHRSCFDPIQQEVRASFGLLKCPDCDSAGFERYFLGPSSGGPPKWLGLKCSSCGRPGLGDLWKPARDPCRFCGCPIIAAIHAMKIYKTVYIEWGVHEICFGRLKL